MPEGEAAVKPELMTGMAMDYLGAVFKKGKNISYVTVWPTEETIVPKLDVEKKDERFRFALANARVFSDGQVASPERRWRLIVDAWLTELKVAADRAKIDREALRNSEDDIRAMMAISSSARAMEQTAGNAEKYIFYITGGDSDLDKQDYWAEFLLHNDEGKLHRVIAMDVVRHYYDKIIRDAGMKGLEWNDEEQRYMRKGKDGEWEEGRWETDKGRAFHGKLVGYLSTKNPYEERRQRLKKLERLTDSEEAELLSRAKEWEKRNSFDDYIAEVLLEDIENLTDEEGAFIEGCWDRGLGPEEMWAAAKLAADAFLVDQFTEWEYEVDEYKVGEEDSLKLKPTPGWGGNPFRALVEPSFLPRRIKEVYKDDPGVLQMLDRALRPDDLLEKDEEGSYKVADGAIREKIEEALPIPSATIHFKKYARFNRALSAIIVTSRAQGLPQWSKDTISKDLPNALELLDQVYGGTEDPDGQEIKLGKQLMGLIAARVVEVKALAAALESTKPGFRDNMAILFGEEKERPFMEILQFLYGRKYDYKGGFFDSLLGGRTRLIFRNNIFGAERNLMSIWEILRTTDQDAGTRSRAKKWEKLRFGVEVATALANIGGSNRRRS